MKRALFPAIAIGAALAVACAKDKPAAVDAAASAAPSSSSLLTFIFADAGPSPAVSVPPPAFDPAPYVSAAPTSAKSIGHTSVVFKLHLAGNLEAAFKPESKRGKKRWRGEVAAYRLGTALKLPNVPPALARGFDASALQASTAKEPGAAKLYDDEVVVRGSEVRGAIIPWIPKLEFLPLESASWRARFTGWLTKDGVTPEDQVTLAAQISTMIVFDLLTGNWDRWSGGNVGLDRANNVLLFIDNDGAFFDPAPPQPLAAQQALFKKIDKFSRSFVSHLRALDPIALADAIGMDAIGDAGTEPLFAPKILADVDARRRQVLSAIDAKIALFGEASVLAFP
ncbi:hypothetical protein BH09MYX1_BH09MYX1_09770 [soil metagenome]